jgi:diacylglycerol O-acyltransferase
MSNRAGVSRRERMSSVDTAWLRMDRATNRMAIVGVLIFDTALDYERLRATLESRLLRYERLRMHPVEGPLGAWWADTPRFDIAKHLRRARLPGDGDAAALQRFVGKLAVQPFDPRRPWWEFHLVERYGSGSALVVRIHHSYADGIALIGVMLSLTDESPDAPSPPLRPSGDVTRTSDDSSPWDGAFQISSAFLEKYTEFIRDPAKLMDYAKVVASAAAELAQLATMADDSRTRFKGKAGTEKVVAWTDSLPLDEVKAVGKALGCSVNDVLLASVAGALRRYLVAKGDIVEGVELRAMVPVNLRPPKDDGKLGNRFGLVTLLLPVGLANPLARLYEIHRRMDALKSSYQPLIAFTLLGIAGLCPRALQELLLDLLANKATAVMTNVPGPQKLLYLAGARLANLMFWVPQSGDIGMGVSILSYNGGVQFGLITDAAMVPDPEQVIGYFRPELERLLLTVLMEPWDEPREPDLVERELAAAIEAPRVNRHA